MMSFSSGAGSSEPAISSPSWIIQTIPLHVILMSGTVHRVSFLSSTPSLNTGIMPRIPYSNFRTSSYFCCTFSSTHISNLYGYSVPFIFNFCNSFSNILVPYKISGRNPSRCHIVNDFILAWCNTKLRVNPAQRIRLCVADFIFLPIACAFRFYCPAQGRGFVGN